MARCCVTYRSSAEREGLSTHLQRECSAEPFMCSILLYHYGSSRLSPVLAYEFLSRCKFSTLTSILLYSSRLYAQNPVFEKVNEESVKIHLHMYNGNARQNPPYVCR